MYFLLSILIKAKLENINFTDEDIGKFYYQNQCELTLEMIKSYFKTIHNS